MVTKARILLEGGDRMPRPRSWPTPRTWSGTTGPAGRRKDVLTAWAEALARAGDHARAYEIMREAALPTR